MQIIPLSEGAFTIGHDKVFVPFDAEKDILTERPTGSLLVEVQPFLIVTEADVILFDTGLGFQKNGIPQLHQNLMSHGFGPEQVTKVLLSHLHKDHAGGVLYEDEQGIIKPTLPGAKYFIHRKEADYALEKGYPSYHPDELEPLFSCGQVEWLDGERGNVDPTIFWEHSGAHCPWHIVWRIDGEERKIFFGGDEAPQLKQLKIRYVAKYDFDGKKAMELRETYAAQGRHEGWEFLFYHDIATPVARL